VTDGYDLKRCAKCAAWIPTTATMCSYCGTSSPDKPLERPRGPVLSLRHGVGATQALIALNVAYFLFSLVVAKARDPQGNLLQWMITGTGFPGGAWLSGAYLHGWVVETGEWWRALSMAFLHYGLIHIGMNMLALRDLGRFAEDLYGTSKFLVVYVLSALGASAAIAWTAAHASAESPVGIAAGASGAVFGVLGLLAVRLLRAGTDRGRQIGMMFVKNIAFMLAVGLVVPFISNAGHVGGLLVGAGCAFVVPDRFAARLRPKSQGVWAAAGWICVAAIAASLVLAARFALTYRREG
jgi:membrane associated rhomboid family serine protease